ncbi:MAG: cyclohexanecarboxyl-CoA dehydrogenase [Chromatiales bacterium]|jgi:cyclohexanecarboxyl-CoA dehydrogenase|nr:cyclohexanecarboxyl-CoA dehydrogenase [Chromatiales bacterium]
MSIDFSDEQYAIQEVATRFAKDRLAPNYQRQEQAGQFDREILRDMGSLGLLGPDLPEHLGGLDAGSVTAGIVMESTAYADPNVGYLPLLTSLIGGILAEFAKPALALEVVPKMISAEHLVALGLTEPRGGSDAANLIMKATATDGGYRLNGEKTSISLANQADAVVLFARTGEVSERGRGVSAFYADLNSPGVNRTTFDDLGSRAVGRGSLSFTDVFVPYEHRLGDEGSGFIQVMQGFDYSRALIGLQCVAPARASLDETWQYIQERKAFDTPLAQFQGVTFPLAEGETKYTACRLLCYQTLALRDRGAPHTSEAAMCKWWAPKIACEIIEQCLLSHGHSGYSMDLPHQQRMRDIFGFQIGDGTAQIMKLIIAREKAGRMAVQY